MSCSAISAKGYSQWTNRLYLYFSSLKWEGKGMSTNITITTYFEQQRWVDAFLQPDGLNLLFAVGGGAAKALADAAVQSGMTAASVQYFPTSDAAAAAVVASVKAGDLVLVKGSRSVKTDRVVERLKAERG